MTASTTCPACGLSAPAGARYCSNCAGPLPPPADPPGQATSQPHTRGPAHRRTGTSGWIKVLIVALVVGVVAAVSVAVVLAIGAHNASNDLNAALTPKPGRPPGYRGPAYPGMLVQDHVATSSAATSAGATIEVGGESLTAGDLKRTATFLGPTLCSPVTVTNHSLATKDVGPAEWKLQQPNGIVETFAITGTLLSGQIAPGGTASGTACFADSGQAGTFVLLWQPLLRVDRGVWRLQI